MPKKNKRGRAHTTLTESAEQVVAALKRVAGIKMIAPGRIEPARNSRQPRVTAKFTSGGMELLIVGQSVQRVAVHLIDPARAAVVFTELQAEKVLKNFTFVTRQDLMGRV